MVAGISPAHPEQLQAAADVTALFAEVTDQAAQSVRGLQAALDEADTGKAAEAVRQLRQALDELGGWIRANSDVLPVIMAIIGAGSAGGSREAPP